MEAIKQRLLHEHWGGRRLEFSGMWMINFIQLYLVWIGWEKHK